MKKSLTMALLYAILATVPAFSETKTEYEAVVALSVGGASPIPLPVEIRDIDGFNPGVNPQIRGSVTRRWGKAGINAGLQFGRKSMETGARVKNYSTEVTKDDSRVSGRWTGKVFTSYSSWDISVPILATWKFSSSFQAGIGLYAGYVVNSSFGGYVTDGYLRQGDPTGPKVEFTENEKGNYSFPDGLRKVLSGAVAEATWYFSEHFGMSTALNWDFASIFKSSFTTVSFDMNRIYGVIGLTYRL
ncbi:MAG: PorT family protein [Bacteroidales bacterium]|nr:PorT family protein [Bacteroidales bacterium]